ncbi:YbjQ family protein [Candidatus Saccharibacteria bacterium]|nr:YbjQ family protein [Candidatus Saccharibacteria bacterium]
MLLSTTTTIEGKKIAEYRGIVFGEVVNGIDFTKDIMASIINIAGGRSEEYEQEIIDARADAITEMSKRAEKIGANAIVGVKIDYEPISTGNSGASMLIVTASGTAVVLE